jgi:hypothetical protein
VARSRALLDLFPGPSPAITLLATDSIMPQRSSGEWTVDGQNCWDVVALVAPGMETQTQRCGAFRGAFQPAGSAPVAILRWTREEGPG